MIDKIAAISNYLSENIRLLHIGRAVILLGSDVFLME
jgi:hypothetical protein